MNISSEIYESNYSHYYFLNGTEVESKFEMSLYEIGFLILSIVMSLPINSYVMWLIVTGTGNGLTAEYFILNLCVWEIIFSVESLICCLASKLKFLWTVVAFLDGLVVTGRPLFECLMCVERYLAVIHPVTFLKYKPLRYRLMCSAVAYVATFASSGLCVVIYLFFAKLYIYYVIVIFFIFLSIQLFCCLAVLRVLKQSGPGERGRERGEENHTKTRAFYLIVINTMSTLIIYIPYICTLCIPNVYPNVKVILSCTCQFCYVSAGLVQPVFFLYRVGKLKFIKCQ